MKERKKLLPGALVPFDDTYEEKQLHFPIQRINK